MFDDTTGAPAPEETTPAVEPETTETAAPTQE